MDTRIEKGESALTAHELAARRAGDGERSTRRALARLGEVVAPGGALVLFVSTLLHPLNSDPNAPRAAFAEYTADSVWVWSHLGQFAGLAMLGAALVALAATLEPGRAAAWARIGVAGAASMVTVGAALQAVDGVALKVVVDCWASVTGEASASAFEAAFAVRQIEVGLASLLSLVSGLTLTVFGVALALNARYPAWLGGLGLLGGIGTVASGAAQASTGFSGLAITISMLASIVLLVWTVVVGFLMWRSAPRLEAIPHDDRYRKGPVRDGAGSPAFGASAKKIAPPESRKHEGERSDGQDQHALPRLERGVARRTDRDGNAHGDRRPRRDQTEVQPEDPGGGLVTAAAFTSLLLIPFSTTLLEKGEASEIPLWMLAAGSLVQGAAVVAIFGGLGLWLGPKVGLGVLDLRGVLSALSLTAGLGITLGAVLLALDAGLRPLLPDAVRRSFEEIDTPAPWEGFLASIGAGVNEEILFRLGLMTLFVVVGAKLLRQERRPAPWVVWTAMALAALLFGTIHLPQAAELGGGLPASLVAYTLLGNGLGGMVFGWLYWKRGLVAAMTAHFAVDVVLYVIAPAVGSIT